MRTSQMVFRLSVIILWTTLSVQTGWAKGNSDAAHWCAANFPPGHRGACVSQAALGRGPFFACGPGGTKVGLCGQVCCQRGEVCAVNGCAIPTPIPSATPTDTPTNTLTPTDTATQTPAAIPSPTATATARLGPQITFFGIGTKNGCVACADTLCQCVLNGYPTPTPFVGPGPQVFVPEKGFDFTIVVEAKPGGDGVAVVTDPGVPANSIDQRPNLQIEGTRDMQMPGPTPCMGGIQGIDPPDFGPGQNITDALQSFACQFGFFPLNSPPFPCTLDASGTKNYVNPLSTAQFCDKAVQSAQALPSGDNVLTVQLKDKMGNLGPTAQIIVRVPLPGPTPTPTI